MVDFEIGSPYLKSLSGIFKVIRMVLNVFGLIFVLTSGTIYTFSPAIYFCIIELSSIFINGLLLGFGLCNKTPWPKIELFIGYLLGSLYIISSCLAFACFFLAPVSYIGIGVCNILIVTTYSIDLYNIHKLF